MDGNNAQYTPEALSCLPRKKLSNMLANELKKDTQHIDDGFVRLLLAELQTRDADPAFTDDTAVQAACEKYQMDTKKSQQNWPQHWILKVASAVLVLGILFFTLPGTAQADIVKDMLAWWSDSVFQFILPGKHPLVQEYVYKTDHPGLQQLYNTVTELGVTEPIVPRWIPDELELVELKSYPMSKGTSIISCLSSKESYVIFTYNIHDSSVVFQHEKNENVVKVWDLAGCEHYVLSNKDEYIVTWITDNIECTINIDCPEEDVYNMLKSIYTTEG